MGKQGYEELRERLAAYGLKPRIVNTLKMHASGIGRTAEFILFAEIPVGIGGVSGIITIHVLKHNVPFLLPVICLQEFGDDHEHA